MVDYFLKVDGIKGESADAEFKDQIQLDSFTWSEAQTGISDANGGGGAGKVKVQDFHFTARLSEASTSLFLNCASGKHIPKAVLCARKAGGKQVVFLRMIFTDCLVSSYKVTGYGNADVVPTDNVSLNFAKMEVQYYKQNPNGSVSPAGQAGWDVKANHKV